MSEHPFPQPKARELSREEADALLRTAFDCERRIKGAVLLVHGATWELAEALHDFHELRGWSLLGYETLNEFLGQPEIGISRAYFFRLVQVWEDLVVVRQVAPARLKGIEPTKITEVLPAIMRGDVRPDDALDDAAALSKSDLREKYRQSRDNSVSLDASVEPVRMRCPTCRTWVTEDQLPKVIEGTARERSTALDGKGRSA